MKQICPDWRPHITFQHKKMRLYYSRKWRQEIVESNEPNTKATYEYLRRVWNVS